MNQFYLKWKEKEELFRNQFNYKKNEIHFYFERHFMKITKHPHLFYLFMLFVTILGT